MRGARSERMVESEVVDAESRRWLGDVPEVGSRPLTDDERERIRRWTAPDRRWAKFYQRFLRALGLLECVVLPSVIFLLGRPGQPARMPWALATMCAVVASLLLGGWLVGVVEVFVGRTRTARVGFGALTLGMAIGVLLFASFGERWVGVMALSGLAGTVGGMTVLGSSWRRLGDIRARHRAVDAGLARGEAARFVGRDTSLADGHETPPSFDVRVPDDPRHPVGVALTRGGVRLDPPTLAFVPVVASSVSPRVDAPLGASVGVEAPPGSELRQRHLTRAERAELLGLARRTLRTGATSALVQLWMLAVLVNMVNMRFPVSPPVRMRWDLLGVATLWALAWFARAARQAHRLRRDAANGILVVVRSTSTGGLENAQLPCEVLPRAKRIWTLGCVPAPWRIARPRL